MYGSYDSYSNENFEDDDEPIDPSYVHQQQQRRVNNSNDNDGAGSYMREFEKEYSQRMKLNYPQQSLQSPHLSHNNRHGHSQNTGSKSNSSSNGTGRKQDVAKARARLGLLKSKMR